MATFGRTPHQRRRVSIPPTPQRLWRSRIKNALQTLLIMVSLALVLSIPGYLFAGPFGVVLCFATLLLVALAPTLSTLLQLALSRNREYTADLDQLATHTPTSERIRRLMALVPPDRPSFPFDDTVPDDPPTLHQRPGPMGHRYWILRR
ncbi:M48 family metalloprotease [Halomonas faecis]|uniref:hypothetical protein n=1 Tax=Halomonas faecis TaxID=1562110 RepID=UPI0013D7397E|nr:hypothetical protein [Halomonas faecis]